MHSLPSLSSFHWLNFTFLLRSDDKQVYCIYMDISRRLPFRPPSKMYTYPYSCGERQLSANFKLSACSRSQYLERGRDVYMTGEGILYSTGRVGNKTYMRLKHCKDKPRPTSLRRSVPLPNVLVPMQTPPILLRSTGPHQNSHAPRVQTQFASSHVFPE